ncbi:hypothetical protein [Delftia tsuruhatensis]|uniref:hypothetical protein n=1 Tax=Delftia tsuruhatensis TaxID=180282 RepID=UPI000B18C2E5|nr:hypothetical protein [Delftia tsuruhatensis]
MSLDAVISADLVKTRAEIAALGTAVAAARSEISGLNNQLSSSSTIKSIQRGVIDLAGSLSKTASIIAVIPGKSALRNLGNTGAFSSVSSVSSDGWAVYYTYASNTVMVELVNGSQIKATTPLATASPYGTQVSWELVEYK